MSETTLLSAPFSVGPNQLVIVDDEPRVTGALKRELELEYGSQRFIIVPFNDSASCLDYIKSHSNLVFLVISDLRMPEVNGAGLLHQIRALAPDVQTVLLTAYADVPNIQHAISSGLQGLIFKPWNIEGLKSEVEKAWQMAALRVENTRLRAEIDSMLVAAGEFQRVFLGDALGAAGPSPRVEVEYQPSSPAWCSGDFFDLVRLGPGKATFLLGDVVGHGPKSAFVTMLLKTITHDLKRTSRDLFLSPRLLVTKVNQRLCSLLSRSPEILVALSVVHLDFPRGRLVATVAGQPGIHWYTDRSSGVIPGTNTVLGVSPDASFDESDHVLDDQVLYLFTDGLVDAARVGPAVSADEAAEELRQGIGSSLPQVVESFRLRHPGQRFTDDVTLARVSR